MTRIALKPTVEFINKVDKFSEKLGLSRAAVCEMSTWLIMDLIEQEIVHADALLELQKASERRGRKSMLMKGWIIKEAPETECT